MDHRVCGAGDGEIFKITAAGVFTVLYSFDSNHEAA